jgi:hypothetical protein
MTQRATSHIPIWREPTEGGALWGWRRYERPDHGLYFRAQGSGDPGYIHPMAHRALCQDFGAILRSVNVLVGWGECRVEATPAADVLAIVSRLRPLTVICPEREKGDRWIISNFGAPVSFPKAGIQGAVDRFVDETFPNWQPGVTFQPHAMMFRTDVSGEEFGIVERVLPTPDDIYASVADDPGVIAAGKLWDLATPSTHRNLVAAVLGAQERAGIAAGNRAPLQSGAVDDYLMPLLFRVGRDDEGPLLNHMRRDLHRRYGEFAEIVLLFMLRTYRHGGTEKLLALATAKAACDEQTCRD